MKTANRAAKIQCSVFETTISFYLLPRKLRFDFVLVLALSSLLPIAACSSDDDGSEGGIIGTGVNLPAVATVRSMTNGNGTTGDSSVDAGGVKDNGAPGGNSISIPNLISIKQHKD